MSKADRKELISELVECMDVDELVNFTADHLKIGALRDTISNFEQHIAALEGKFTRTEGAVMAI